LILLIKIFGNLREIRKKISNNNRTL